MTEKREQNKKWHEEMTTGGVKVRRRIKKKKGLLKDPEYEQLKKQIFLELQEKMTYLERRSQKENEL